jgi:hypothetical protein
MFWPKLRSCRFGETKKRRDEKEVRLDRVGSWEDAVRSLKEGGNTVYF